MSFVNDIYLSRKPLGGFVAIGLAWSAYFAQMPVIKSGVDASDGAYGIAVLWASFGAVAAMWLAPLAANRAGRYAVPVGIALIMVGIMGAGMVPTLWGLAIMLVLLSGGSGIVDVLINAEVADIEAQTDRSLMNLNHGLYSLSYAASAIVVGALREAGWTPVEVFSALMALFVLLMWTTTGRSVELDDKEILPDGVRLPSGLIWLAGIVIFFAFLTEAASESWSALHIERGLGGSAQQGALGPAMLGLMMGVGRLSGHAVARYVPEVTLMVICCLITAAGLVGAALAPTVLVALLSFSVAGLGVSVVGPLTLAIAGRSVPKSIRLAVISRVSVLGYGAFFFGPPLMGLISEGYSLSTSFLTVAVVIAVVAVTLVPLLGRYRRIRVEV
ncbi:MFS transporter [Sulfitobacter sp. S190]|uniref:MFS transporter n=1 Tax=Sulfitobacter sp. S190 TaxID=2867022 RepID=UPI0021A88865|nr:MFS transporter [Sulfitobacter sp. S190]UWR23286.1 MFS transporter [Sulfitobacter sp. S190]